MCAALEFYWEAPSAHDRDRYWAYKNAWSVDGLPGMKRGLLVGNAERVAPIKKWVGPTAVKRYRAGYYTLDHIILTAAICLTAGILLSVYGSELWLAILAQLRNVGDRMVQHSK